MIVNTTITPGPWIALFLVVGKNQESTFEQSNKHIQMDAKLYYQEPYQLEIRWGKVFILTQNQLIDVRSYRVSVSIFQIYNFDNFETAFNLNKNSFQWNFLKELQYALTAFKFENNFSFIFVISTFWKKWHN